jgi:tetratricopeptide (TPR) repeat protein
VDFRPPVEVFPKAKIYAQKAIALNDKLGEGHFALGEIYYFYDWDWAAAQKELELTLQLDPQAAEKSACYVHSLDATGNSEGAITHVKRALELNPLSIGIQGELGCASYYARQYDQALTFSRQTLEMDPNFDLASYNIARAYGQKGMFREAMSALNNIGPFTELPPMIVAELGYVYARLGEKEKASTMLEELKRRAARGEYVDPYPVSFIYAGLGDTEQALEYLQKSVKVRSSWIPWLKVEPKFDILRADPRFQSLLTRIGMQ